MSCPNVTPTTATPPVVDAFCPYTPIAGAPVEAVLPPATPMPLAELVMPATEVPLELAVRVPFTVWFPVNVLAAPNCAYKALVAVVFRLNVTLPLVPPPVRSVPAVTPVIVPVPTAAHTHELPLYCST